MLTCQAEEIEIMKRPLMAQTTVKIKSLLMCIGKALRSRHKITRDRGHLRLPRILTLVKATLHHQRGHQKRTWRHQLNHTKLKPTQITRLNPKGNSTPQR